MLGWVVTLAYGITALACLLCSRRASPPLTGFWFYLALALLFLGLNKQLDLQTSLTAYGKCLAVAQGWYPYRRIAQFLFFLIVVAFALWVLIRTIRLTWPYRATLGFVMAGIFALTIYVTGRAMGIHHVDSVLGWTANSGFMKNLLEVIALTAIFTNTALVSRQGPR